MFNRFFLQKLKEETTKRSEAEAKLSLAETNHANEVKALKEMVNKGPPGGGNLSFHILLFVHLSD